MKEMDLFAELSSNKIMTSLTEIGRSLLSSPRKYVILGQGISRIAFKGSYIAETFALDSSLTSYLQDKVICISNNDESYGNNRLFRLYNSSNASIRRKLCPILHFAKIGVNSAFISPFANFVDPYVAVKSLDGYLKAITPQLADELKMTFYGRNIQKISEYDRFNVKPEDYWELILETSYIEIAGEVIADLRADNIGSINGVKYGTDNVVVFDYSFL